MWAVFFPGSRPCCHGQALGINKTDSIRPKSMPLAWRSSLVKPFHPLNIFSCRFRSGSCALCLVYDWRRSKGRYISWNSIFIRQEILFQFERLWMMQATLCALICTASFWKLWNGRRRCVNFLSHLFFCALVFSRWMLPLFASWRWGERCRTIF